MLGIKQGDYSVKIKTYFKISRIRTKDTF